MTPTPVRSAIVAAAIEPTKGVAVVLDETNAGFRVMNPVIKPVGSAVLIPAGVGNADIASVLGQYSAAMNFDVHLYEGAWRSIFLPACGFDDGDDTDIWTFTDDFTLWETVTANLWYGAGRKYGMAGGMGSFGIRFPTGFPATASFRMKGILVDAGALVTGVDYEATKPPVFAKTAALTIGGDATVAGDGFELVSDDYAILIPSPNVAGAYVHAWIKKPNFRIKFNPLATAAKDWVADWKAGTSTAFSAVLDGGAANKITVSGTGVHLSAPDHNEQDEQLVTPIELAILNNSLSIKFE